MKQLVSLAAAAAVLAISSALAPVDAANRKTDFALFDGTNPDNVDAGVVCHVDRLQTGKPWNFHVAVSSFGGTQFRLIYRDGDFVPFNVPTGTSFSLSQSAGVNASSTAIRVDNSNDAGAAGVAGAVSAEGINGTKVTCISCDADSDGDAACDDIVPN